jgi:hypothetical protein
MPLYRIYLQNKTVDVEAFRHRLNLPESPDPFYELQDSKGETVALFRASQILGLVRKEHLVKEE